MVVWGKMKKTRVNEEGIQEGWLGIVGERGVEDIRGEGFGRIVGKGER